MDMNKLFFVLLVLFGSLVCSCAMMRPESLYVQVAASGHAVRIVRTQCAKVAAIPGTPNCPIKLVEPMAVKDVVDIANHQSWNFAPTIPIAGMDEIHVSLDYLGNVEVVMVEFRSGGKVASCRLSEVADAPECFGDYCGRLFRTDKSGMCHLLAPPIHIIAEEEVIFR